MQRTTKVIYMRNNSCGNQYAHGNVSPYGTKWRVNLVHNGGSYYNVIGNPILLDSNWEVDEEKCQDCSVEIAEMGLVF
jgi:hypothetical protein